MSKKQSGSNRKAKFAVGFAFLAFIAGVIYMQGPPPIEISTFQDLVDVQNDLTAHYILMNDIDAQGQSLNPIGVVTAPPSVNPFSGTFDGNEHIISNVVIASGSFDYGFFQSIQNATVTDLGIENLTFTNNAPSTAIGAFAGKISGTSNVSNCYVTAGAVDSTAAAFLGAGGFTGNVLDTATVEDCYVIADSVLAQAAFTSIGGFTSSISAGATVQNSYVVIPTVTGAGSTTAGFTPSATGTVTASFWDDDVCNQNASTQGTAKTTPEMKDESTFTGAGWDFTSTWTIDPTINDGYPIFQWQLPPSVPAPPAAEVAAPLIAGGTAPVEEPGVSPRVVLAAVVTSMTMISIAAVYLLRRN